MIEMGRILVTSVIKAQFSLANNFLFTNNEPDMYT